MSGRFVPDHAELARLVAEARSAGRRVVFTNGGFEILHVGHVRSLQDARSRGDLLVVAVNSDASIRRNKGAGRPVVPAAERVEMHMTLRDGEILRMRQVKELGIPAGSKLALAPGGAHLMLINIKRPLKAGDKVPVTLRFAKAGEVKVELSVRAPPKPAAKQQHRH